MTPATQLAAVRSLIEGAPDAMGLIDRCDLIDKTFVDGGSGGDTMTPSTLASNQACMVEEITTGEQIVVGGEAFTATGRVFTLWSAGSKALTEKGHIKILAREPFPIMYLQKPTRVSESFAPLAEFKGVLIKQGYT